MADFSPSTSRHRSWGLLAVTIWALTATFAAVVIQLRSQQELVRIKKENAAKSIPTLKRLLYGLHEPVEQGAKIPARLFEEWIPAANAEKLANGATKYEWVTETSIGGPRFHYLEVNSDQIVTKIDVLTPEW